MTISAVVSDKVLIVIANTDFAPITTLGSVAAIAATAARDVFLVSIVSNSSSQTTTPPAWTPCPEVRRSFAEGVSQELHSPWWPKHMLGRMHRWQRLWIAKHRTHSNAWYGSVLILHSVPQHP